MSPTKKKRMKKRDRKKKVMIDIRRQSKFVRRSARQPQTSKDFLLVESRKLPHTWIRLLFFLYCFYALSRVSILWWQG
jgi:hypothetical protein